MRPKAQLTLKWRFSSLNELNPDDIFQSYRRLRTKFTLFVPCEAVMEGHIYLFTLTVTQPVTSFHSSSSSELQTLYLCPIWQRYPQLAPFRVFFKGNPYNYNMFFSPHRLFLSKHRYETYFMSDADAGAKILPSKKHRLQKYSSNLICTEEKTKQNKKISSKLLLHFLAHVLSRKSWLNSNKSIQQLERFPALQLGNERSAETKRGNFAFVLNRL